MDYAAAAAAGVQPAHGAAGGAPHDVPRHCAAGVGTAACAEGGLPRAGWAVGDDRRQRFREDELAARPHAGIQRVENQRGCRADGGFHAGEHGGRQA